MRSSFGRLLLFHVNIRDHDIGEFTRTFGEGVAPLFKFAKGRVPTVVVRSNQFFDTFQIIELQGHGHDHDGVTIEIVLFEEGFDIGGCFLFMAGPRP